MLAELRIENLGVIESVELVIGTGLTVLTGETGAGKTMLVEAISLLVGGRSDAMTVRGGTSQTRVEGRFQSDDELVLARVVPADGRSRAYVNGRLATVGQLSELGTRLVDLHGQHAHQSLLTTAVQRGALDHYGAVDLGPLRSARGAVTEVDAALAALGGDARMRAREIDLLRFQLAELEAATISDETEDGRLDAEEDLLAGASEHRNTALESVAAITDDGAALDAVGRAIAMVGSRAPFTPYAERLRAVVAELADIATDLRRAADAIDEDPNRLAEVRARRQLLRDLRRKYGDTLADVIAFTTAARARLADLDAYEERAAELEAERNRAVARASHEAHVVRIAREQAAPELARAVRQHLRRLAMPHADVEVRVAGADPGDEVAFLLTANPGSALLPLARVASGGELARTMLALRLVLSEAPDTLLFDEVDAGIGGQAAVAVGRALADLADRHQVLVVTHLAQVAALADHHVVVSKRVVDDRTVADARVVSGEDRVAEVARMLSGQSGSGVAREHALELITGSAEQ